MRAAGEEFQKQKVLIKELRRKQKSLREEVTAKRKALGNTGSGNL